MNKGIIFKIQKFCLDDGPGIRTTIFFKGCSLSCNWCHNGEGLLKEPSLGYFEEKCDGCHACEKACPVKAHYWKEGIHNIHREVCQKCGRCVQVCTKNALKQIGKEYSVEELMSEIRKDIPFYRQSGGGVTFSGGEPLLQAEFCKELAEACAEENIPIVIETAGHVKQEAFDMLIPYVSLWLYDIKESRENRFYEETKGNLKIVLDNLNRLKQKQCRILLRSPIIPGIQDSEEHFIFLKKIADKTEGIQLMPYHNTGVYKSEVYGLNKQMEYRVPTQEEIEVWNHKIAESYDKLTEIS